MTVRRLGLVGGMVVAVLGVFAAAPALVEAQNEEQRLDQVERQMAELERLIESAEAERTAYVEQIEETEARMEELRVRLWAAEDQLTSADAAVAVSRDAFTGLSRRVRLMDAELAKTRLDQRVTGESLRERTVEMYMSSATGINSLFAGAWDPESNTIRLEYSRRLLEDTELLLHSLEILERQEVTRQEELVREQERAAELLTRLEAEQALAEQYRAEVASAREQLGEELSRQEELLAEVIGEIEDHEDHVAALEAESKRIELEILRRQVREGRAPGVLAWPVGGALTSPYGWRIHPIFGDRRLHTGIDLRGSTGEPIHAAANGTVILAGTWGGYGRTVVVDHGGGLSTLYAHASRIAASEGEEVLAGEVVAYVGCTGFCTGPHLHFEVREVGSPVDPMLYLPR